MKQLLKKIKNGRALTGLLAVILTLSVTLSSFVGVLVSAEDPAIDLWDGTTVAPTVGDGSEANPTLISTPEQLAYVLQGGGEGKYYKITTDLYLNDVDEINWETGAVTGGYSLNTWTPATFNGNIDGDGHIIYGLYINGNPSDYTSETVGIGLISKVSGSVHLENLGIDNVFINANGVAGAFVGIAGSGSYGGRIKMDNCYVGQNVYIKATAAGALIGWGAFSNPGTGIENYAVIDSCYSLANLTGVKHNGDNKTSLLGAAWGGWWSVTHCYSLTYVAPDAGGCSNNYSAVQGSAESTAVALRDKANMVGTEVLTAATGMPNLGSEYVATTGYPVLSVFVPQIEVDEAVWDKSTKAPTEGDGQEDTPYLISSAEQFAYVMDKGGEGKHYKLTADIYLNEVKNDYVNWKTGDVTLGYDVRSWTPKAFNGTIDGDGHVVYGLYINNKPAAYDSTSAYYGLITQPTSGGSVTIKNFGIDNAYFDVNGSVAAFVGYSSSSTGRINVSTSYVGENVTIKGTAAGVVVAWGAFNSPSSGDNYLVIDSCYSLATLIGVSYNSADKMTLYGAAWGGWYTITRCYATHYVATAGVSSSYSTTQSGSGVTKVEDAQMKGEGALANMPNLGEAFVITNGYPTLGIFLPDAPIDPDTPIDPDIPIDPNAPTLPEGVVVWDGGMDAPADDGLGTPDDPVIINTAREFAYVMNYSGGTAGKHWKLGSDIYLNDITKINWDTGAKTDSKYEIKTWSPKNFTAVLNGNGYHIYGLYINNNPTSYTNENNPVGLITKPDGTATFQKLGIDYMYINVDGTVGAFAGRAGTSSSDGGRLSITNSYVGENVTLKGVAVGAFVAWGSFAKPTDGGTNYLVIDTCYSHADLTAVKHSTKEFLHGGAWSGWYTISNCYATHDLASAGVSSSYSTTQDGQDGVTFVNDADIKGANALKAMSKLSNAFVTTDSYPVLFAFTPEASIKEGDIWSGRIALEFEKGTGEKTNPYIISNGAELALALTSANYKGKYFKLSKDIYLNDVSVEGWETADTNNQWVNTSDFNGHIDGDGHIVYGVWFPADTNNETSALITNFSKGTIEKLGLRKSFINATRNAGGIVGITRIGGIKVIDKCFVDETVRVEYTAGNGVAAGGIVGYAETDSSSAEVRLTVSNCYSKAVVVSLSNQAFRANGIIGTAWMCSYVITNCYSYGEPPMAADSARNTSYLYKGADEITVIRPMNEIFKNLYTDKREPLNEFELFTTLASEKMRGNNARTYMSGLDFENVFETVANGTPKLKIFESIDGADIAVERNDLYASGTGTKDDPYIIKTELHLRNLIRATDTKGKYYSLANDIYLNDVSNPNWTNNNPNKWFSGTTGFAGTFQGNGHTVYGIYMNDKPKDFNEATFVPTFIGTGLFPAATGDAVIKNVHVRSSYISGSGYVGSIVGYATVGNSGRATIIGCSADETVSLYGESVGGIVGGGGKGVVLNYCYFTGKILYATPTRANGMVGDLWNNNQEVAQCYSAGYTNYRTTPSYIEALYGTVKNDGTSVLTKAQMIGADAKKYMTQLNWDVWQVVDGKTPHLRVVKDEEIISFTYDGEVGKPWSGQFASGFAGGSGTEKDPYLIETPEQLAYLIGTYYSKTDEYYKIVADIIINDTSYQGWERNAKNWFADYLVFRGHLDGDGHIISGLYYKGEGGGKAALIPVITQNASVKRLGIVNSSINNPLANGTQGYTAAFVAYVHHWLEAPMENAVAPLISECFADHTVTVTGQYAGGIAGGAPSPIHIENSYFTGSLRGEEYRGGLMGNSWMTRAYHKFHNSYVATEGRDPIGSGGAFSSAGSEDSYKNVYVDGSKGSLSGAYALSLMYMKGSVAKEYMEGFDFDKVWKVVSDGTPVLRCFPNAEKYSCKRQPGKIEIAFATGEGSKCESIYGYPRYTEIPELPTPTRYGYEFGGWYCFVECDVPFTEKFFPDFDTVLYAKWIPLGFTVDFEGNLDAKYDYNSAVEHYKPGVSGYDPAFLCSGLKTIHVLGSSDEDALFLVNYSDVLEVGKEYNMHFMMAAGDDGAKGSVMLLHADHPQYDSTIKGYEICLEFSDLKKAEWKEYTYTFTANTPYVIFKIPAGVELFFDDIRFIPTGNDGTLGELIGYPDSNISTEPTDPTEAKTDNTLLIVIIVAAVILLSGVAVVVVIVKRKAGSR